MALDRDRDNDEDGDEDRGRDRDRDSNLDCQRHRHRDGDRHSARAKVNPVCVEPYEALFLRDLRSGLAKGICTKWCC